MVCRRGRERERKRKKSKFREKSSRGFFVQRHKGERGFMPQSCSILGALLRESSERSGRQVDEEGKGEGSKSSFGLGPLGRHAESFPGKCSRSTRRPARDRTQLPLFAVTESGLEEAKVEVVLWACRCRCSQLQRRKVRVGKSCRSTYTSTARTLTYLLVFASRASLPIADQHVHRYNPPIAEERER